ncbi:MAG: SDR family oxidoreductase [Chloroflexi bacterium]|nr:SDR family oxidoreductase [Chloroflexota bacterium]
MNFKNKVVLVTGASRGIGREIARQFAERGARVIVHYGRNQTAAQETIAILNGEGHLMLQADMRWADQLQLLVDTAVAHYGRIDILINNAGVFKEHPLADSSYEAWQAAWQETIDTNLIGVANLCWLVGQQMIGQGYGRIVNVSSRGAFRGEPVAPAYGASKAGLNGMSQSLAKYLAPYNIFVGVVAPGFVETEMAAAHLQGESGAAIKGQSPLNRVATPAEIAYPVLFLASEGAEWLTGTILDANGASYLRT